MAALRTLLCLLAPLLALPQSDDVFQRLRRALAFSGQGEIAAAELNKKNFASVEQLLAEARAGSEDERAELVSLRGAIEFLAGDMRGAAAAFGEARKIAPLRDGDSFTLAMALVALGDDEGARTVLASLTEKRPTNALYLYWLGRIDYYQRRYEEAVEKLSKATELDPTAARAWDSLGLAWDMQGHMDQALSAFEKATRLNRSQAHPSAWPPHNLGYLLLRMQREKQAEAALREALRYDPKLARTHFYLGRVLEKQGRDAEAVEEFKSASAQDTASPDACYSLAMLYRKLERHAEAEAMFAEYRKRRQAVP